MKTRKRLFALVLALCLLLSMTVPAVWAEDTDAAEAESVVYNFDYYSAIAPKEAAWTNVETAWVYLEHTDKSGVEDATVNKTQIDGFYNDGTLNWKVADFKSSYNQSKLRVASFVAPNQGTNQQDYGYFRLGAMEGDWVAFTIKNPGANTEHKITMKYTTYSYGASVGSVYILPADTQDIGAAIAEAEAIGSVNFENSEQNKETPNIPAVTSPIGFWTPGDAEEYIVVLEATEGASGEKTKGWGYLFLSELTMDAVPKTEESAEEVVYNFDYYETVAPGLPGNDAEGVGNCYLYGKTEPTALAAEIQGKYEGGILNWNYLDGYYTYTSAQKLRFLQEGFTEKNNTTQDGFLVARAKVGDWVAFTIKNPGAGIQRTVTMTHPTSKYGAGSSNVYILPSDTQDIGAAIKEAEPVGSVGYYNKDVASCEVPAVLMSNSTVGVWTPGDAEEYIFVLEATEADSTPGVAPYAYMYISKLIMGDGSNITIDPVKPEIVVEDIIRSSEFEEAAIGVNPANGHDYLYLFYRGEKFQVFDLDDRKKVDEETDGFMTPRYTYVDQDGIVWGCGASDFLYRYDPTTGTSEHITIPSELFPIDTTFNCLGLTGDGAGKLYFGTYNRGYLGMYDTKTKEFSRISGWLDIKDPDDSISDEKQVPDTMHSGYPGLVFDNGYIYTTVDGNKNGDQITTHAAIKYSIAEQKIVDYVDISDCVASGAAHMYCISLVGDVLFCSSYSDHTQYCTIDVSGEKMKRIDIDIIKDGYWGCVSEELNGKAYLMGDYMMEYDVATKTVTKTIKNWPYRQMRLYHNTLATITWDDRLPGQSVVTVVNNKQTGSVDVVFYNPQTEEMVLWEGLTAGEGNGNQLQNMVIDPSGENIYVSAYGNNQVAEYNVATGTVTKLMTTYNHQTDGLFWYDGYLYGGNYSSATITRIDVETGTVEPLFELYESAFQQRRMHAMTAGDQKVFAGPTPDSNMYGGVLVWYDLDQELTYVAAGPDPEDVYYADTSDLSVPHVWYSALTGEKADFDQDNDGVDDSYITLDTDADGDGKKDIVQRFNGVIENQIINCMVYKDGYIYGSTSKHGGSGTSFDKYDGCASLFVYDVEAMKLVATYDLCDTIEGLKAPIEMIEVIAEDPDVDGKFWGVVSDTLFSFTFDPETGFSVKEELSFGKKNYYTNVTNMGHRNIVFDGDYMYVVFGGAGTFMINRNNVEDNYLLAIVSPRKLVLAKDGNLYGYVQGDMDLSVLRVADITQSLVAESVQARIDALPETVTEEENAAVAAVRKAYDALSDVAKELVDTTKLEAAEAVLAPGRATAVEALINAIGTVTLESGKVIRTAREAYDALLDGEKALVTNVSTLTAAENAYAALKDAAAAAPVQALIDAIGTVTLESEAAIKAARAAYDALTDSQKAYVTNLKVLTAAEESLAALQNPKTGEMTQLAIFAGILIASAAAMSAVLLSDIRRKHI